MATQMEKFVSTLVKSNKKKADIESVDNKPVEAMIATRIEEKKDMYRTIDILSNSVSLLNRQMEAVLHENGELKTLLTRIDGLVTIAHRSELDVLADHYLAMHRRGELVSRNEIIELGVDQYALIQHKQRAEQIREQGFFVDPIIEDTEEFEFADDEVAAEPVVKVAVVKELIPGAWAIKWKPGKKPHHIIDALNYVNAHMGATQIKWPKDELALKALVKNFLVLAQYEQIDIHNTTIIQKSRYLCVHMKVNRVFGSYKTLMKELF